MVIMKRIDVNELSSTEYKFFKQNEQHTWAEIDDLRGLMDYPPFSMSEKGEINYALFNDFDYELNQIIDNIDENDMVGEIYKPFKNLETKYKNELDTARSFKNAHMSQYDALKKWVEDKKITLDPGVAYHYGP